MAPVLTTQNKFARDLYERFKTDRYHRLSDLSDDELLLLCERVADAAGGWFKTDVLEHEIRGLRAELSDLRQLYQHG